MLENPASYPRPRAPAGELDTPHLHVCTEDTGASAQRPPESATPTCSLANPPSESLIEDGLPQDTQGLQEGLGGPATDGVWSGGTLRPEARGRHTRLHYSGVEFPGRHFTLQKSTKTLYLHNIKK